MVLILSEANLGPRRQVFVAGVGGAEPKNLLWYLLLLLSLLLLAILRR